MTLLEVIICLFLSSHLFLGVAMVHIKLINTMLAIHSYTIANQQVSNLMEYLKIATPLEQKEILDRWINETQQLLPHGLVVTTKNHDERQFKIFWGGASEANCSRTLLDKNGCLYVTL